MKQVIAGEVGASVARSERGRTVLRRKKIRVLIVDDALVMRKVISEVLGGDPEIVVVGTAPNGIEALRRLEELKPDLITLDIEMPGMNGLEVLTQLRHRRLDVRVIMISSLTARGASATFEALALGAHDYLTKPANSPSLEHSVAQLQSQLIPKIKQFFPAESGVVEWPPLIREQTSLARVSQRQPRVFRPQVVVIGVSTGGPNALAAIMPQFPANFPLPILIVQHMPPMFTKQLADGLSLKSKIKIQEASDGQVVLRGQALVAPGEYHLKLARESARLIVRLDQAPPENFCRPAVDVLFRSAAGQLGDKVLSVVLTGMGQDGLKGVQLIKDAGGMCLVQDEKTSVVWGMPGAIAKAGIADEILSLDAIVPKILTYV